MTTITISSAIRIVLVEPSHPGNIGAVARAMKNMALRELWLVKPKQFPDPEATARASGAENRRGPRYRLDDGHGSEPRQHPHR